ncbi:hypothetical protein GCM10011386_14620 [Parapedobacter defluvii]|uniref:Sigma-70 family RNA polymerase sigma factor n=1 Tax=Parapedobacter defluvii TaxID=2045106 RepID=A0ABQ1LH51_9SPHI|nr:sigma-70 family RNA polymerase sigma factor [Parapedobacter defluvii]GGC23728.1 hypothetical protein GCM10011386_14620 [Parapedobacter defluvii]
MKRSDTQICDSELVSRLREGNESAFTLIYERYWRELYNKAYKRLMDYELAFDIVQEIYCDLWARRFELEIPHLPAYLHQAVKFQVYKAIRKGKSTAQFFERFERLSNTAAADVSLLEKELHERLHQWLAKLPDNKRRLFKMRYEEEKSTSEIAGIMNISQKTVQNQLSLTHLDLKTKLLSLLL